MLKIEIQKDGEWYLAKLKWYDNIFAYWLTVQQAIEELINVISMIVEETNDTKLKFFLEQLSPVSYAI